jgi:hypothetical protein
METVDLETVDLMLINSAPVGEHPSFSINQHRPLHPRKFVGDLTIGPRQLLIILLTVAARRTNSR